VFAENTLLALVLIFLMQFACRFSALPICLCYENRDAQLQRGALCT